MRQNNQALTFARRRDPLTPCGFAALTLLTASAFLHVSAPLRFDVLCAWHASVERWNDSIPFRPAWQGLDGISLEALLLPAIIPRQPKIPPSLARLPDAPATAEYLRGPERPRSAAHGPSVVILELLHQAFLNFRAITPARWPIGKVRIPHRRDWHFPEAARSANPQVKGGTPSRILGAKPPYGAKALESRLRVDGSIRPSAERRVTVALALLHSRKRINP